MTPDLSHASDGDLSAFLHAVVFGLPIRCEDGIGPDGKGGYCRLTHADRPGGDRLLNLVTPDGAETVVEAMGEEGWTCVREFDPAKAPETRHFASFQPIRIRPGSRYKDYPTLQTEAASSPRAVCEAATLARYPSANPDARALLIKTDTTDA